MKQSKSAFTMVELVFVIVIIGILAAVAVPRLAATRDDAEIVKAKVTVASIRNALSMERQKRILRGDFAQITAVGGGAEVFGHFDNNSSLPTVLEYVISSSTDSGHWSVNAAGTEYTFNQNNLVNPIFIVSGGKFICKTGSDCSALVD
jgi:general secretion pathway protein G